MSKPFTVEEFRTMVRSFQTTLMLFCEDEFRVDNGRAKAAKLLQGRLKETAFEYLSAVSNDRKTWTDLNWKFLMLFEDQMVSMQEFIKEMITSNPSLKTKMLNALLTKEASLPTKQSQRPKEHVELPEYEQEDIPFVLKEATFFKSPDWKTYALTKINKSLVICPDEATTKKIETERIISALQDRQIAQILRQRLPWLLPTANLTLFDLVNNRHDAWAPLVIALFCFAERLIPERLISTFPTSNILTDIEAALKELDRVDILELLIFDPNIAVEERQRTWRSSFEGFVGLGQLQSWSGVNVGFGGQSSANLIQVMFERVMLMVNKPTLAGERAVREQLIKMAIDSNLFPTSIVHHLSTLTATLLAPTLLAQEQCFTLPPQSWRAAKFLAELKISNSALEDQLSKLESDLTMFDHLPKAEWPNFLITLGAKGVEPLIVTNALFQAKLIK